MRLKEWLSFGLLGLIWGSSFLWIKIAIGELGPFALVAWRLLFGLAGLALVVAVRRPSFPRDRRSLWAMAFARADQHSSAPRAHFMGRKDD